MTIRIAVAIFALNLTIFGEDADNQKRIIHHVSPVFREIPGTLLWERGFHDMPEGGQWSHVKCVIGYKRESEDGKGSEIIPILSLPTLKNDMYEFAVENGILHISAAKSKKVIASFHISNFVPALLTKGLKVSKEDKTAEQDVRQK